MCSLVHRQSFSLTIFKILPLSLIFDILMIKCLSVYLFGFILCGALCASWTWKSVFFPGLGKILAIISSSEFSALFSLFSHEILIIQMLVHLILSQRSLILFSFLKLFFFCYSAQVISTTLSFRSLIHSFASSNPLLIPSHVIFISVTVFFYFAF